MYVCMHKVAHKFGTTSFLISDENGFSFKTTRSYISKPNLTQIGLSAYLDKV